MNKVGVLLVALSASLLTPLFALAQFGGSGDITEFIGNLNDFINDQLIPLVFAIALLVFLWGAFRFFILGGHDEDKRKEGRNLMFYAIIGFVLMVSVFGIVNLIARGLGFSGGSNENLNNIPDAPYFNP